MIQNYISYFIYLFIAIISYIGYKLLKKELGNNKIKTIKEIIVLLSVVSFIYIMRIYRGYYLYGIDYIKAIQIILSIAFLLYTFGLLDNKEKTYQRNIKIYILLYFILLISITFIIGRIEIKLDLRNFQRFYKEYLIPFNSIKRYINPNVSLRTRMYNLFGNSVMLMPLSFLLILKNDKYKKIRNQIKVILPTILLVEFFQLYSDTGVFDIDDIILNFFGAIVFTFLITRFRISDKIKTTFYKDFKLNQKVKYLLFIVSTIIPVLFILDTIKITIQYI